MFSFLRRTRYPSDKKIIRNTKIKYANDLHSVYIKICYRELPRKPHGLARG